jgi:5-oxoprolinase (ATP-hydrolysing)
LAQSPLGDEFTIKVLSSGATKNGWSGWRERGEFSDPLQSDRPQDFWCGYQIRWLDDRGNCLGEAEVTEFVCGGLFRIADVPAPVRSGNPKSYELVSPEPSPIFAFRQMLGLALHESLPPVSMFLGTTRGTNALLTRRGSRTALVTTLGFGDILEIGEQDRPNLFDVTIRKPRPLYERVIEVDERLGADGSVLRPLDREQV